MRTIGKMWGKVIWHEKRIYISNKPRIKRRTSHGPHLIGEHRWRSGESAPPLTTLVPGSIPRPGIICELSLLVLSCASRVFSPVLRFSSLHKNQPWFDLGCAPWPDMSRMAAAWGVFVCLGLGHDRLRPRNSATELWGWLANPKLVYTFTLGLASCDIKLVLFRLTWRQRRSRKHFMCKIPSENQMVSTWDSIASENTPKQDYNIPAGWVVSIAKTEALLYSYFTL